MKCSNCGYSSFNDFTICPSCDRPCNIDSNSEDEYISVNPARNNPDFYNNPNMNPSVRNLPEKKTEGYFEATNGFRIKQTVKDGDFYQNYLLYNIILFLFCLVVCFILLSYSLIICVIAYFVLYLLTGWIYNILFNSFNFDVNQNGIYIKSALKEYFIDKSKLKDFTFKSITKKLDELDRYNLYSIILYGQPQSSGYSTSNRRYSSRYSGNVNFHRFYGGVSKTNRTKRQEYNIFFVLDIPISVKGTFLGNKKYLQYINTGLSFEYSSEARFLVEEFKRVLQI